MKKLILITILFPMTAALAWDGIEPSSGTKIEITSRLSKVKKGNTVEIFDHGKTNTMKSKSTGFPATAGT